MSESEINKTPSPVKEDHKQPLNLLKRRNTPSSRSNSVRSKGIGLNLAVSPVSISPSQQQNQTQTQQHLLLQLPALANNANTNASNNSSAGTVHRRNKSNSSTSHLPQVPESSVSSPNLSAPQNPGEDWKYDIPLPAMRDLMNLDIEEQLRLLALKEMSIVEIKDSISSLNTKLNNSEKELHKLREVIQKLLYNELNSNKGGRPRQDSNPRDEAIASTKRSRRRTLSLNQDKDSQDGLVVSEMEQPETSSKGGDRSSSIWSNLSKPLNLIQQFDTMLQNEFERSLIPQNQPHQTGSGYTNSHLQPNRKDHNPRLSEDSNSSSSSIPSPLKGKSTKNDQINLDQFIEEGGLTNGINENSRARGRNRDDMMQAVSSSLWSFVNDVRTNVMNSLNDEDESTNTILQQSDTSTDKPEPESHIYNLDNGSSVSVDNRIDEDDFNKILNLKKD